MCFSWGKGRRRTWRERGSRGDGGLPACLAADGLGRSVSGAIGLSGIAGAALGRMLVGNDHRTLIPAAALAALIMLCSPTRWRALWCPPRNCPWRRHCRCRGSGILSICCAGTLG